MTILADTGPLYALIDRSDSWHKRVTKWWGAAARDIRIPVTVLPEVCYLLQTRVGPEAEQAFVQALADGELVTEDLVGEDIQRAGELVAEYADLTLGFVDATIIATAERLGVREILTTDRKHFSVVRPQHLKAFKLMP